MTGFKLSMLHRYEEVWLAFQSFLISSGSSVVLGAVVLDFTSFLLHEEGLAPATTRSCLLTLKVPLHQKFGIVADPEMLDVQRRTFF